MTSDQRERCRAAPGGQARVDQHRRQVVGERRATEGRGQEPGQRDADLDGGEEPVGVLGEPRRRSRRGGRGAPARVTWLSRSETSAISAAAKNPPIRTKTRTSTMLASVPFTGL